MGLATVLAILLLPHSAVLANEPDPSATESSAVVDLEIPRDGDRPIIVVESLGKKLRFLVKTTSAVTTYDVRWVPHLGTALRTDFVTDANGTLSKKEYFRPPKLRVGPLLPNLEEVEVSNLKLVNQSVDNRIDGFLGLDVLRQFVVTLDCDRGVLQLRPSLPADPGEELPLRFDKNGLPVVALALGGKPPTPFAICTGSTVAMLVRPPVFAELRERNVIRSTNPAIGARELADQCATGIVGDVMLGSYIHRNAAVEAWAFDGLGMDYLARYIVTLDFPRRKVYFKPGKAVDRIDRLDQCGLQIMKREGQVVVDFVVANSPAWESGILVGDVLRRVNDTPISAFSLFELRRLLQTEESRVAIAVGRDGEPLEFEVALRNYNDVDAESKRRTAALPSPAARPQAATVIAEFDVGRRGEPLVVPVTIEGFERPLNMLVDTGSHRTFFDYGLCAKLGKSIGWEPASTPDGESAMYEQIRVGAASLGGVRLRHASIGLGGDRMIDIFRRLFGYDDLDGILGMDLLCGQIVQIDFDAGKLRLLTAVDGDAGHRVDLFYRPSGIPVLAATFDGMDRHWFRVDTGCAAWNFCDEQIFSALTARGAVHGVHQGHTFQKSGAFIRKRWCVDRLEVGPFGHRDIGFRSAQINALGLFYLSRYVVTFDFPGHAIYLKKGKLYDRPEPYDKSGLCICKEDGKYVVFDVFPGSPASDAGIFSGDVILRFDGRDVTNYSLFELGEILSDAGKSVALSLRRDGERMEHELLLREYFGGRILTTPKSPRPTTSAPAENDKKTSPVRR
jgi:membrane-associated protease RseP (regulator of RpoE activity)